MSSSTMNSETLSRITPVPRRYAANTPLSSSMHARCAKMLNTSSTTYTGTSKQAMQRAGMCLVSCLAVFAGFAMSAFHPQQRALHDIITKTKVVWRGETDE